MSDKTSTAIRPDTKAILRGTRPLLVAASAAAGVQALAHAALFITSKPEVNPRASRVVAAMRAEQFEYGVLGSRTYWDFYFGYGLVAVILAVFIAAVIGIAAASNDGVTQRRLIACTATVVAAHAALIAVYFFVLPLAFDLLVLALLVAAIARRRVGAV
jgi:hypothetical protein